MLQQAIIVAWKNVEGERDKSKIPAIFINYCMIFVTIIFRTATNSGFVSLFTAQLSDRVIAFKLHRF